VSVRTVRYWDAGRCRVPWSAVRLLRFVRLGDLGALHDGWDGWVINRNGLWSPDGKHYGEPAMRHWWVTCEQARFWRDDYSRRAGERLEGASPGAPSTWVADGLHSPPLVVPDPSATPLPRQTALFVLPVAAGLVDAAAVQAAVRSLPALANAGVFLADPAMLAAQFPALAQSPSLQLDSNLLSQCHRIEYFTPVPPGKRVGGVGPYANRGQKIHFGDK
jgi:hypothetical protein